MRDSKVSGFFFVSLKLRKRRKENAGQGEKSKTLGMVM